MAGVIAMWVASSRTEQAERDRQGAALTDEELVLYDCFERARLKHIDRIFYREGYIEVTIDYQICNCLGCQFVGNTLS